MRRRGNYRPSKVVTEGREEWKNLKFILFYKEILNSETFKYIFMAVQDLSCSTKDVWYFLQHARSLVAACGIKFPDQGSKAVPLHWKWRILATGPSLKSPKFLIYWGWEIKRGKECAVGFKQCILMGKHLVSYFQIIIQPYAPNDQSGKWERNRQWNRAIQMNSSPQNLTKVETNNEMVAPRYYNSLKVKVEKSMVVSSKEKSILLPYHPKIITEKIF